jgi:ATP-dependent Clp protease ATP-binding subunit ClpA
MRDFFKPELRNRIDLVCKFKKLDTLAVRKIVVKFINELKKSLKTRNIEITIKESAIDYLAEKGYDSKMGARPLSRKIDEMIKIPMSKKILFDSIENCNIVVDIKNEQTILTTKTRKTHVRNTENQ